MRRKTVRERAQNLERKSCGALKANQWPRDARAGRKASGRAMPTEAPQGLAISGKGGWRGGEGEGGRGRQARRLVWGDECRPAWAALTVQYVGEKLNCGPARANLLGGAPPDLDCEIRAGSRR